MEIIWVLVSLYCHKKFRRRPNDSVTACVSFTIKIIIKIHRDVKEILQVPPGEKVNMGITGGRKEHLI